MAVVLLPHSLSQAVDASGCLLRLKPELRHDVRIARFPKVRCGEGARGRGLFVAAATPAGDVLAVESAAVWQRGDADGDVFVAGAAVEEGDATALQMAPFAPNSSTSSSPALTHPGLVGGTAGAAAATAAAMTRRELLAAAMQANCFEVSDGAGGDAALFPIICLANHSCLPNAVVQQQQHGGGGGGGGGDGDMQDATSADGGWGWGGDDLEVDVVDSSGGGAEGGCGGEGEAEGQPGTDDCGSGSGRARRERRPQYALRARRPLVAGEEVLISYMPRSWPRARRRAAARELWKFDCGCERCADPRGDDTVVLRLPRGACACGRGAGGGGGGDDGGDGDDQAEEGRAYLPDPPSTAATCVGCGASVDLAALPNAAALLAAGAEGALAALAVRSDAGCSELEEVADGLLSHPVLAPDDARVLAALNALAGHVAAKLGEADEELGEDAGDVGGGGGGEAEGLRSLLGRLLGAVATVALRSRFLAPQDLGLDVEVEEGAGGGGEGEGEGAGGR